MLPDQFPHAKPNRCRGTGRGLPVLPSESPAPRITDSEVSYGMAIARPNAYAPAYN